MKYILYCRKSTDTEDRQALSLESQEQEMLRVAEAHGIHVHTILRESMSAKTPGRPVFKKMITMLRSGVADGILCWKLDRLARNMIEGGEIMDMLQSGAIKEIRTYESAHQPSENTLLLAVHFGMANQYSRDLSANVKRGNRTKLERGEWPNKAPFGYRNKRDTKTIVPAHPHAQAVVRIFELYASGLYTLRQVASKICDEGYRTKGGKRITKGVVDCILKHPFYYGAMPHGAVLYAGKHKPLITKARFDEVQRLLHSNQRPRTKRLFFPLRGLLFCGGCGCTYTASLKKGHTYYHCTKGRGTCPQSSQYLTESNANGLVVEALERVRFDSELVDIMYAAALERERKNTSYHKDTRERLQSRLSALTQLESSAFDAFASQLLSRSLYEEKMRAVVAERIAITHELKGVQNSDPLVTLEPIREVFLTANKAKNEFLNATPERKQVIAKTLLWNLTVQGKKAAQTQYNSVYQVLANAPKSADLHSLLGD